MADATIGALNVRISADNRGFKDTIKDTQKDLSKTRKSLNDNAAEFAKWSAAGVTAAAAVGAAIFQSTSQNIRELNNLAQAANTVTAEFQRGAFAAQTVGIEQEKYGDILKNVTDRIGDFVTTGGGPMTDFFEQVAPKIGITTEAFRGLSGQDALGLFVRSLEEANLSQEEMTFHLEAIASDSTRLLPLLQNNSEAFNALTAEAEALGVGLSEVDAQQVEMAAQAIDSAGAAMGAVIEEVVAEFAPLVKVIADGFTDAAKSGEGFSNEVATGADVVVNAIGFVMDAVEGISRTFDVLGQTVALTVLGIQEGMLMAADFIVNKPVEAINELIEALNKLPWHNIDPVEMSGFGETIKSELQTVREAIDIGVQDISDTLNEPMPSEGLKEGIAQAKEEAKQLQAQAAEARRIREEQQAEAKAQRGAESPELSDDTAALRERLKSEDQIMAEKFANDQAALAESLKNKEITQAEHLDLMQQLEAEKADQMRELKVAKAGEESAALLEAMQERFATEREAEDEKFILDQEALAAQREQGLITEDEHMSLVEQRNAEHVKRLNDIRRAEQRQKLQNAAESFSKLAQVTAVGGKKTEKITRALSITSATIKGYESAVSAFAAGSKIGGPVLGAVYAAASVAQTSAMISKLKSGSKGSPAVGTPSLPTSVPGQAAGGGDTEPQVARRVDINIAGEGFFSAEQVRQLIDQINEQTDSGVQLNATLSQ